ncbi:MAG: methylenetetrahydrofolate reductase [NAD(P)H] [Saprospiraceae bacterium]|nr:methylenetetrahydrofolate reductase [NAD(P)H] [Saprospiraceae bacterium]
MKITDHFTQAEGNTLVSFEVLPPLKGGSMQDIFDTLDPLMEFNPPFIDVTYHREEFVYNKRASGYYEKTAIRKRPGTVGICASIMHHYGVDAIPHLICGGFSKEETENALIDLQFLGIHNVLALRGDARKFEDKFIPETDGHKYAVELVQQIHEMNHGNYLDTSIERGAKTDFCVGVAGYPEKHFESPNFQQDIQYLKDKIDAGASYIVTQMFFDNKKFFNFKKACEDAGINVPIIPGIKPLTKKYQLNSIPRKFFVDFPEELVKQVVNTHEDAIVDLGIEWCISQCKELKESGVPCIHFYTMSDSKIIYKVAEKL